MAHDEAYQNAEKKIEEAGRSRKTELGLGWMELTELPESLGQLTQLQSLSLDNNQLTALPGSIGNISGLTKLWIGNHPEGGNPMAVVPQCICHLKQLQ